MLRMDYDGIITQVLQRIDPVTMRKMARKRMLRDYTGTDYENHLIRVVAQAAASSALVMVIEANPDLP
jgi:hypothetical protein